MKPQGDDARYARLAARALGSEEVASAPSSLGDRAATVAAIETALRARGRRRLRVWIAVAVPAAAAVVLLAMGRTALRPPLVAEVAPAAPPASVSAPPATVATIDGGEGVIELAGTSLRAAVGSKVIAGARLRSGTGSDLTFVLPTGTRLRLGAASSTRVVGLDAIQRFDLDGGTMEAAVAKLEPGRRFLIATPDAEIEVKGTRFEVAVGADASRCGARVRTRVSVREGVVVVRHEGEEIQVTAGSAWPAPCEEFRSVAAKVNRSGTLRARGAAPAPAAAATADALPPETQSTLGEQNDLFAAALASGRRGDVEVALRLLDRLIARYPNGQLVDSARAERRRLIAAAARGDRPE